MPLVEIGTQYLNPMHVISVEPDIIKKIVVEDEDETPPTPGLHSNKKVEEETMNCVKILCKDDYKVIIEGTGDAQAVAKLISEALDKCLMLCGTSHVIQEPKKQN